MELEDIINRVSANSDIRVIVVGSRLAKFFTAGLDVTQPSVLAAGNDLDAARRALAIRGHLTVSFPKKPDSVGGAAMSNLGNLLPGLNNQHH